MRTALFLALLLAGSAAAAQTMPPADPADPAQALLQPAPPPGAIPPPLSTPAPMGLTTQADPAATVPASQTVMPGNSAPERDARGIPVVSDPASAPAGFNQTPDALAGMGGPLVDASARPTPQPADASYPACSRTVTDNCVQTYERGRAPQ